MRHIFALLNLLQSGVYFAAAAELAGRSGLAGVAVGLPAVAAVVAAVAWEVGKEGIVARVSSALGLIGAFTLVGLYLQVALHLQQQFGPLAASQGWDLVWEVALYLPWLVFFPLAQLLWLWRSVPVSGALTNSAQGTATAALAVLGLALPLAHGARAAAPDVVYETVNGAVVARWLHNRITGGEPWLFPEGDTPIRLVVSLWSGGVPTEVAEGSGPNLAEALRSITLRSRDRSVWVVTEVVREEGPLWAPELAIPGVWFYRPMETALLGGVAPQPANAIWRSPARVKRMVGPGVFTPGLVGNAFDELEPTRWARVDAWMSNGKETVALDRGWTAPPPLTATSAGDAARRAAHHLRRNRQRGHFSMDVSAPAGERSNGAHYPSLAGASWFMAAAATSTGDERLQDVGVASLRYLEERNVSLGHGRSAVVDPGRDDGRAWIGTTALALLGALELKAPSSMVDPWVALVADAVDADGRVRGDVQLSDGVFLTQPLNSTAQGQVMLALAKALAAGHESARAPLERAAAFVAPGGGYLPWPGAALAAKDEPWMCLVAEATEGVLEAAAGEALCGATLSATSMMVPRPGAWQQPPTRSASLTGLAWVARARLDQKRGVDLGYRRGAMHFARSFLQNQYRWPDRLHLANEKRLMGGFRDGPFGLDAELETATQAGLTLLAVEQLLGGPAPR